MGVNMIDKSINLGKALNIIFKTTTKSAQIFADFYLRKDISIISRWRNNVVIPKSGDLRKIVEFTLNESTGVQRIVIKDELIKLLNNSSIKKEIKNVILEKDSFEDFLVEFLSALTIERDMAKENIRQKTSSNNTRLYNPIDNTKSRSHKRTPLMPERTLLVIIQPQ